MGVATWRNVQGVSPESGVSSIKSAGDFFNRAISGAGKQVKGLQQDLVKRNTDEALNRIRGIDTQEDFDASFDQFSPEALGKYVDQAAIRGAYDAQGKKIEGNFLKEEKRDLAEQQLGFDKLRLGDQISDREQTIVATNVIDYLPSDEAKFNTNVIAGSKAQDVINAARAKSNESLPSGLFGEKPLGFIEPVEIIQPDGSFNFEGVSPEEQATFLKSNKEFGGKEILNFSGNVANAKKQLQKAGVGGKVLKDTLASFKLSLNENKFSNDEIAEHNQEQDILKSTFAAEVSSAIEVFDTALANNPLDKVLTVEEELGAKNTLLTSLSSRFPDEVFGSRFSGDLGGTELQDEISSIMTNGIQTPKGIQKPSAAVIEQLLLGASKGNKNDFFFDNFVDKDTLHEDLQNYFKKDPKAQRAMLRSNIKNQKSKHTNKLANNLRKELKNLKGLYDASAGKKRPGQNTQYLNF